MVAVTQDLTSSLVTTDDNETIVLAGIEDVETRLVGTLRGVGKSDIQGLCALCTLGTSGLVREEIECAVFSHIDTDFLSHHGIAGQCQTQYQEFVNVLHYEKVNY